VADWVELAWSDSESVVVVDVEAEAPLVWIVPEDWMVSFSEPPSVSS
jgi:hypothetical protein